MNKPTIDKLIALMSPETLASFIIDLEPEVSRITHYSYDKALEALINNVGAEESYRMLGQKVS